jgi:mRNA-degrading endonuclease RelE of RelBE toxin-antitoxin system
MPPETAPGPALYGIVQLPDVMKALTIDSAAQAKLAQAIYELQTNPRPDGHEPADEYSAGLTSLVIDKTAPPYTIVYSIDDDNRRVIVIAVYEKRWG